MTHKNMKYIISSLIGLLLIAGCSNTTAPTNDNWEKVTEETNTEAPKATEKPKVDEKTDEKEKVTPPVVDIDESTFRSMKSGPWKITMGYPKDWYWGNDGGFYGFSIEPSDEKTENLIELAAYKDYPGKPGKAGFVKIEDGIYENDTDPNETLVCKEITESEIYCLGGGKEQHQTMVKMIKTLKKTEE